MKCAAANSSLILNLQKVVWIRNGNLLIFFFPCLFITVAVQYMLKKLRTSAVTAQSEKKEQTTSYVSFSIDEKTICD